MHGVLAAEREAWRRRRLAEAEAASGSPVWAHVLAGLVDLAFSRRGETLALLEFEALADPEQPALLGAVRAEHLAQDGFWRETARRLGADDGALPVWSNLARAATRLALVDREPAAAVRWLAPALLRVAERLDRRPPTPAATPWLAAAVLPGALPARPAGAQRLVDAALRMIGQRGLHAVTLRNVAQAAGLSLASTTYFFATKAEIIHAAFTQLRDAISQAALDVARREGAASGVLLTPSDGMRWEAGAIQALFLAGARSDDLQPVAASLRRLSGQTSSAWLARHTDAVSDRLDAFIWSCFGTGVQEHLGHLEPAARREALDRLTLAAVARIFGATVTPG